MPRRNMEGSPEHLRGCELRAGPASAGGGLLSGGAIHCLPRPLLLLLHWRPELLLLLRLLLLLLLARRPGQVSAAPLYPASTEANQNPTATI